MSFGFSVGDFIAVGKLIASVVSSLKESTGSAADYQELDRELASLKKALEHVDRLRPVTEGQRAGLEAVKAAALMCAHPLEEFLGKVKKYEGSLGLGGLGGSKGRNLERKLRWGFTMKSEVQRLRDYLSVHVGSINMLLMAQGLEALSLVAGKEEEVLGEARVAREEIGEKVDETKDAVVGVGSRVEAYEAESRSAHVEIRDRVDGMKMAVVRVEKTMGLQRIESRSLLGRLLLVLSGDVVPQLKSLVETAATVLKTNLQIYSIVLKWQTEGTPRPDIRHTWFQDPVRFEDALGRILPVPSEYTYGMLEALIKERFREGPGRIKVMNGEYEVYNTRNTSQLISDTAHTELYPGMALTMAIVVPKPYEDTECCPMPHCMARTFTKSKCGGNICSGCGVFFEQAARKRKRVAEIESLEVEGEDEHKDRSSGNDRNGAEDQRQRDGPSKKRRLRDQEPTTIGLEEDRKSMECFRNIRVDDSYPRRKSSISETMKDMSKLVNQLIDQGKFAEAEDMCRKKLAEAQGEFSTDIANWMDHLGLALENQGKFDEAEIELRKAWAIELHMRGKEHPETLTRMNNLALVLKKQLKFEEAEKMHREELQLSEKVLGPEHPETLMSMNNLALALDSQGKHAESEPLHRRTLELRQDKLGMAHPETFSSMNNLVYSLTNQAKYEEAESIGRRTLDLRQSVLGPEHVGTLRSTSNLASVLSRQGKYEEAEPITRRVLEARARTLGEEHPSTLLSMDMLLKTLMEQRKYTEAEPMRRRAVELKRKVFGPDHSKTLISMSHLAVALESLEKYEEGEQVYREELKLRGASDPKTADVMEDVAYMLNKQKKFMEANAMYRQADLLRSRMGWR